MLHKNRLLINLRASPFLRLHRLYPISILIQERGRKKDPPPFQLLIQHRPGLYPQLPEPRLVLTLRLHRPPRQRILLRPLYLLRSEPLVKSNALVLHGR